MAANPKKRVRTEDLGPNKRQKTEHDLSDDGSSTSEVELPDESDAWFIGHHTLMPKLQADPELYRKIPMLAKNNGRLPPYLICVGDKRRVRAAGKLLDDVVFLHDEMQKLGADVGRIAIALGTYKGTPIAIFEHQMGCGGAEIICRELVSPLISSREYKTDKNEYAAKEKYVIRIGSCGGINSGKETKKSDIVKIYDVIISSHSVGISGCHIQAALGMLNFFEVDLKQCREQFEKLGYKVHEDGWMVQKCDKEFCAAMKANILEKLTTKGSKASAHLLGSFSKDSLYCETNEENFMKLRERFDVGCTEMEFDALRLMASEFKRRGEPVKVGMACVAIGVLPGASFALVDKKEASRSIDSALLGAFETLHQYASETRKAL